MQTRGRYRSLLTRVTFGLLLIVGLLIVWQIQWTLRSAIRNLERTALEGVVSDMTLLQTTLDFALAAGATEQVARELTARAADPSVVELLLVDEAGQVVASRLRHEVGLPAEEVLGEPLPPDMLEAARGRRLGQARLSDDGRLIRSTYPVVLGARPGHIRADRIGVLVGVYSLDRDRAEVHARLWRQAVEIVLALGVGAGILVGWAQFVIGRRVRRLVAATERFASGDLDTRASIEGNDELSVIGAAFDGMAARVGETQRRVVASEVRFRTLVESVPIGILRTDPHGSVRGSNPAWREIAGGYEGDWPGALHPDDRDAVLREWADARVCGRTAQAECRLVRPDGRVVWVQAQAVVERAPTGEPAGFINTVVDLTERREAEETRARLEARLQEAQKLEALGTLASGVAHDFNNVLAVILGYAEVLAREVDGNPAAEGHVQQVLRAAGRGRALSKQILAFASPGVRQVREVRIGPLLDEVAGFLRPSVPPNVDLRVVIDAGVPNLVADPDQLHRALVNLATNALHAMQAEGGVLEMGARAVQVDEALARRVPGARVGPAVLLWVRDEGCGMDQVTRARIFEPFFTTKPHGRGTGLGLAVVRGIVQAHNGAIAVESAPGQGTTFSVYLPVAVRPATAIQPAPGPARPARILYVDDDEALLELAVHAFRTRAAHVTTCARPDEALALFRSDPTAFDLVVTDQRMPEMLGEELVAALKEIRPDLPIVLMSGHVTSDDAQRIRALGARAVVEKPMSITDLVELCEGVLGGRERPG